MTTPTSSEKWIISAWSVLAVFVILNPLTYFITNSIFSIIGAPTIQNSKGPLGLAAPTLFGFVLHLVVFFLLIRVMMEIDLPGSS
jgi:hypothetical protein